MTDAGESRSDGSLLAEGDSDLAQVERFLEITKDLNPLHSDPDFARSKGFAGPIVPAGLSGSWLMEQLDWRPGRGLKVELLFVHPLLIGEPFRIWQTRKGPGREEINLETRSGEVCVVLRVG
jgi:acyl dehydratase